MLRTCPALVSSEISDDETKLEVKSNFTKEEYMAVVEKGKEHIKNGDISQIVLSQRFEISDSPKPFDVYRMLRSTNPSPYLYFFDHKDYCFAGASPEMLVSVTDGVVVTKPIAGTMPRGKTEKEDKELELLRRTNVLTLLHRRQKVSFIAYRQTALQAHAAASLPILTASSVR